MMVIIEKGPLISVSLSNFGSSISTSDNISSENSNCILLILNCFVKIIIRNEKKTIKPKKNIKFLLMCRKKFKLTRQS